MFLGELLQQAVKSSQGKGLGYPLLEFGRQLGLAADCLDGTDRNRTSCWSQAGAWPLAWPV